MNSETGGQPLRYHIVRMLPYSLDFVVPESSMSEFDDRSDPIEVPEQRGGVTLLQEQPEISIGPIVEPQLIPSPSLVDQLVARAQCPHPICQEFRQIVGEFTMGKPLEQCLIETRDRLNSENFALFSAAMLASRESGGRLNETVERIAHSVLEMQRVERKVRSETAQARTSALYMALAPFFILLLYYFVVDPVNTEKLFTTFPGQLILSTAIIFNVVAYLWARQILNPDI